MDYMLNPHDLHHLVQPAGARVRSRRALLGVGDFLRPGVHAPERPGIKTSARINSALAAAMGVVIAIFFAAAARYIFGHPHDGAGFFTRPFYDPHFATRKAVLGGTSIAVLTYIGFDGISTLSEEAENPRRNILLATVLTCLVIGILSAVEVYAAQLIWPASQPFPTSTPPSSTSPAAPGSRCSASSASLCWWPISAQAWARRSARPVCSTAWAAATRCQNLFSARSTPSIASRATTYSSSEPSPSSAHSS